MADELDIGRAITVRIENVAAFPKIYFENGDIGGVIIALSEHLAVGERCKLDIAFAAENVVFHTRGIARWRRMHAQRELPAGIGVELEPTERRTRDMILGFVNGRKVELVERGSRRFPVRIPVDYKTMAYTGTDVTDDLSAGGCFIQTDDLPGIGESIDLELKPPVFRRAISLTGEVVWRQNNTCRGIGVRFVEVGRGDRKKLEELLRRIAEHTAQAASAPL